MMQWSPRDALPASVSSATFSCDGLLVYAAFVDGAVGVFEANSLRLRCQIAPSAYISGYSSLFFFFFSKLISLHLRDTWLDDEELQRDNCLFLLEFLVDMPIPW